MGTISAAFGKSGKVKVRFSNGTRGREGDTVILPFKRYVSGQGRAEQRALRSSKGMLQDDAVIALCLAEQRSEAQVDTATSQLEELDTTGGGATGEVVAERQGSSSPMQQSLVGTIERLKGETTSDGKNPMAICAGLFSSSEEAERYIDSEATTELGTRQFQKYCPLFFLTILRFGRRAGRHLICVWQTGQGPRHVYGRDGSSSGLQSVRSEKDLITLKLLINRVSSEAIKCL